MVRAFPRHLPRYMFATGAACVLAGCGMVPRTHLDDCQRVGQTLRSDNARLKDQVVALQGQNRDFAERAVDDSRRITLQDETIERLQLSVQAYQTERAHLESAYERLTSNLEGLGRGSDQWPNQARRDAGRDADSSPRVSSDRSKSTSSVEDFDANP